MPPYTPVLDLSNGWAGLMAGLQELNFDNYVWLTGDPLYLTAYISSLIIAGISTVLTLLVGYPVAYGMARAPATLRPTLLMLVILPFWTCFLIRVYAWIGILKPEGLLNQALLAMGIIDRPLVILNTHAAIFIGIVYSYLPFMILPLYAALEKMDYSLVEAAQDLGCRPLGAFWKITFPLSLARRRCRLPAGVHPGGRRVRHPRPARRLADPDDRQHPVERVLRQPGLAGVVGRRRHPAAAPGGADHDFPASPGPRPGSGALAMQSSWSRFNIAAIVMGFAFLYLPIVLLVIFSFNESKLVTVWAGFSTKWYGSLFHNQGLMRCGVGHGAGRADLGDRSDGAGHLGALALTRYTRFRGRVLFSGMVFAPLVMPEVITGLSLLLSSCRSVSTAASSP